MKNLLHAGLSQLQPMLVSKRELRNEVSKT